MLSKNTRDKTQLFTKREWVELIHPDHPVVDFTLEHKGSELQAVFVENRTLFGNILLAPRFTPFNISVTHHMDRPEGYNAFEKEIRLLEELHRQTRKYKYVQFKCHKDLVHVPAAPTGEAFCFYACGAWIPANRDTEKLRESLFRNARNHLNHAEEEGISIRNGSLAETESLFRMDPYYYGSGLTIQTLEKIIDRFTQDDQMLFLCAEKNNILYAVGIFFHSGDSWYMLMNLINKEQKCRSANTALIWQGIQHALKNGCHFYFDGSMQTDIMKRFKSLDAASYSYCYGGWYASRFLKKLHAAWL